MDANSNKHLPSENTIEERILSCHDKYKKAHPDKSKWPCPFCFDEYLTKDTCIQHVLTSHENVGCINKSKKCPSQQSTNDTFICNICGFIAKNNRGLKVHSRKHKFDYRSIPSPPCLINNSNVNYDNDSDIPQKSGDNPNGCNSDTNAVPNGVRCNICNKIFKSNGLSIHIAKVHKEQSNVTIAAKYQKSPPSPLIEDQSSNARRNDIVNQCDSNLDEINNKLYNLLGNFDPVVFDVLVDEMISVIKIANTENPGPKHPAQKFYELRKTGHLYKNKNADKEIKRDGDKSKMDKVRRREKYNYQLMQHLYHNQRKQCVHRVMNNSDSGCKIPMKELEEHFSARWSQENNCVRTNYGSIPGQEQMEIDSMFDIFITDDEIHHSIQNIKNDSAPGPDRIYPRTLKLIKCNKVLARVATIMLKWNYVPVSLRLGRTVLIYKKKGDKKDPKNWRPITVPSVIRRAIEKVLEKKLRKYLCFNTNQRGSLPLPGCHINTTILAGCLNEAKNEKKDLVATLLDIHQAYDNAGHKHIKLTLDEEPIPTPLKNIVMSLQSLNSTRIEVNGSRSKIIRLRRGIFQGGSTSPIVFNASINYVINELTDPVVANEYGFKLNNGMILSALGFVDDTATLANSRESAKELYYLAESSFTLSGMKINPSKSKAIIVENGILSEQDLIINNVTNISALKKNEMIKYLGVSYQDQVIINEEQIILDLTEDLQKLMSTPMLFPDQKVSIINQYLWPMMVYPFQTVDVSKLKKSFLNDIDKVVRNAVKNIIGLPDDTPTAMFYTAPSNKGLGLVRSSWEAFIQSYNVNEILEKCDIPVVNYFRNFQREKENCLIKLNITRERLDEENNPGQGSKKKSSLVLRRLVRSDEFKKWCDLPVKGKGVVLFAEVPYANSWIKNRKGISSGEWITALKMNGDVAAVRALHGRSQDGHRCRHISCYEIETLAHVLGFCMKGELLRVLRHNDVRTAIADAFREKGWNVFEEISCVAIDGSNRRIDILIHDGENGFILDPTIRMEIDQNQADEVNSEKQSIYEPCVDYFRKMYRLSKIEVIGLFFGGRGTITNFIEDFRKRFKLKKDLFVKIVLIIIKYSVRILNNHMFSP